MTSFFDLSNDERVLLEKCILKSQEETTPDTPLLRNLQAQNEVLQKRVPPGCVFSWLFGIKNPYVQCFIFNKFEKNIKLKDEIYYHYLLFFIDGIRVLESLKDG